MTEGKRISPAELAWWRSNVDDLRDMTSSDRILRGMLWATLVGGMLLQVVGWLIPEGRFAELVTNVAIALWTGAVLVGLLELRVRSKRRQATRYLAQVEQALGLPHTETAPSVEERLAVLEAKIDDLILRLDGAGSTGRSDLASEPRGPVGVSVQHRLVLDVVPMSGASVVAYCGGPVGR